MADTLSFLSDSATCDCNLVRWCPVLCPFLKRDNNTRSTKVTNILAKTLRNPTRELINNETSMDVGSCPKTMGTLQTDRDDTRNQFCRRKEKLAQAL